MPIKHLSWGFTGRHMRRLAGGTPSGPLVSNTDSQTILVDFGYPVSLDSGFAVTGFEPLYSPDGELVPTIYTIESITPFDANTVQINLTYAGRMKHPQGLVTVEFTGVEPFTKTFAPVIPAPFFNPADIERISLNVAVTAELKKINYASYQSADENISLSVGVTTALIHVNDLEN